MILVWAGLTILGPIWSVFTKRVDLKADYSTANRDSAHLAPYTEEAVIQAYASRAFNWRGLVASHCWISVKPKGMQSYTVYQVVGWRAYRGLPALSIAQDIPDRYWYNERPELIMDIRGRGAEQLIPKIEASAKNYPYAVPYKLWPGPNSNTFPAYIGREVPELRLAMPANAIGKDYLGEKTFFARAPSGTGFQLSLFGVFGILIAAKEGIEINIFSGVYGIKFYPFRILLPGFGQ